MPSFMDIIVRATDQASSVLSGVGKSGEDAGSVIDSAWSKAALATSAVGVAIEGLARAQQDTTFSIDKLAIRTGESADTLRSWGGEISGANDNLGEMVQLMDLGNRRGLEGKQALQDYAGFWDTIGDATGESSTQLAAAGVALAAVGIEAGHEKEAMAALGYVTNNTTSSASDFLQFLGKAGPGLRSMKMDVNDSAAVLGILQNEFGMTGRTAIAQFNSAVNSSDGDMSKLLSTLGISSSTLDTYRGKVAASTDILDKQAAAYDNTRTPMQHFTTWLGNLTGGFGGAIASAAQFAPILIAMGPAVIGLQMGVQALSVAKLFLAGTAIPAVGAAFSFLAANPIVLVIAAIAALILGLMWLWNNCPPFRDAIIGVFNAIAGAIKPIVNVIVGIFKLWWQGVQLYVGFIVAVIKGIIGVAQAIVEPIKTAFTGLVSALTAIVGPPIKAINALFGGIGAGLGAIFDGIKSTVRGAINGMIDVINGITGGLNRFQVHIHFGPANYDWNGLGIPRIPHLAQGAWDIVSNTLAFLHAGEMVVPQTFASGLRATADGGLGGGQPVIVQATLVYSPMVGAASASDLERARQWLGPAIRQIMRDAGYAPLRASRT